LQWYQEDNAYCKDGVLIIEGRHREKTESPLQKESFRLEEIATVYRVYFFFAKNGKEKGVFVWTFRNTGTDTVRKWLMAGDLDIGNNDGVAFVW
jgi:hypothetical protein